MRQESWLAALDHELAALGVDSSDRGAAIVETETFLTDIAEPALEHFGPPASYAAVLAEALSATGRPLAVRSNGPALLSARNLQKSYRKRTVIGGTDLDIESGENVALIGANGIGKSTLLRLLAGVEAADAGNIERRCALGYAPQEGGLDPYLSAIDHLHLFGAARGLNRGAAEREGQRLAEQLGWSCDDRTAAGELSGGTQQKLRVITAMIGDPDLLLLDEPYQGMDAESTRRFWDLMWSWSECGRASLISSHVGDALARVDRVIDLDMALQDQHDEQNTHDAAAKGAP